MQLVAVTKVNPRADDVLEVEGIVQADDGTQSLVQATGWVSAITNHYEPSAYGADGHLVDGAQPRQMTADEQAAYVASLLVPPAPPPPSIDLSHLVAPDAAQLVADVTASTTTEAPA